MSQITTKWIEDDAITAAKLDSSGDFVVQRVTTTGDSTVGGTLKVLGTANFSSPLTLTDATLSGGLKVGTDASVVRRLYAAQVNVTPGAAQVGLIINPQTSYDAIEINAPDSTQLYMLYNGTNFVTGSNARMITSTSSGADMTFTPSQDFAINPGNLVKIAWGGAEIHFSGNEMIFNQNASSYIRNDTGASSTVVITADSTSVLTCARGTVTSSVPLTVTPGASQSGLVVNPQTTFNAIEINGPDSTQLYTLYNGTSFVTGSNARMITSTLYSSDMTFSPSGDFAIDLDMGMLAKVYGVSGETHLSGNEVIFNYNGSSYIRNNAGASSAIVITADSSSILTCDRSKIAVSAAGNSIQITGNDIMYQRNGISYLRNDSGASSEIRVIIDTTQNVQFLRNYTNFYLDTTMARGFQVTGNSYLYGLVGMGAENSSGSVLDLQTVAGQQGLVIFPQDNTTAFKIDAGSGNELYAIYDGAVVDGGTNTFRFSALDSNLWLSTQNFNDMTVSAGVDLILSPYGGATYIDPSNLGGLVGIGKKNDAAAKVEIQTAVDQGGLFIYPQDNTAAFKIDAGSGNELSITYDGDRLFTMYSPTNDLKFSTSNITDMTFAPGANVVLSPGLNTYIDPSNYGGVVCIGTTSSAGARVEIQTAVDQAGLIIYPQDNTAAFMIDNGSGSNLTVTHDGDSLFTVDSAADDLKFVTRNGKDMSCASTGNLSLSTSASLFIDGIEGDTTNVVISGVTLQFTKGILTGVS